MRFLGLLITHSVALALGVMLGIYLLPILTAPEGPSISEVASSSEQALYKTRFHKQVAGSGPIFIGAKAMYLSARPALA